VFRPFILNGVFQLAIVTIPIRLETVRTVSASASARWRTRRRTAIVAAKDITDIRTAGRVNVSWTVPGDGSVRTPADSALANRISVANCVTSAPTVSTTSRIANVS